MSKWIDYSTEHPPNGEKYYIWRLPSTKYENMYVVFAGNYRYRGAGYTSVYSPEFDYWDGYQIIVPKNLQWKEMDGSLEVKKYQTPAHPVIIEGLYNAPCPYCKQVPKWNHKNISMFGQHNRNDAPHISNWWSLECCSYAGTPWVSDPIKLSEYRNGILAQIGGC